MQSQDGDIVGKGRMVFVVMLSLTVLSVHGWAGSARTAVGFKAGISLICSGHSVLEVRDRQQDSIKQDLELKESSAECIQCSVLSHLLFHPFFLSSSVFAWLMELRFLGGDCFYTSDLCRITVIEAFFPGINNGEDMYG